MIEAFEEAGGNQPAALTGDVEGLRVLRELAQRSQTELARDMGISQPTLHKIEKQADIYLSTLRRYVEGLGGALELRVDFPKLGTFTYKPAISNSAARRRPADTQCDQYAEACACVFSSRKASASAIQRHLKIGYNAASRLIERMEEDGLVGPANHVGRREIYRDQDGNPL